MTQPTLIERWIHTHERISQAANDFVDTPLIPWPVAQLVVFPFEFGLVLIPVAFLCALFEA